MLADYHKDVGNRLRQWRTDEGRSVEETSRVLSVSPSHYRKIERGEYKLGIEKVVLLYEYLGIDPLYLLTGKTASPKPHPTKTTDTLNVMQDFFKYITEISEVKDELNKNQADSSESNKDQDEDNGSNWDQEEDEEDV